MHDSFGGYKVLERVGAGGKAEVFRARDTRAGRTAAVKVLTSELAVDPVAGRPFVDDAYAAATLGHPNAAALYEIGEQDGRPYLVYEYVQGQSLKALLGGHPINPRRALEFATQIADALADAHAHGIIHRALRPEKVLVSQKGTAKVIDFGLGHYATAVARQQQTVAGKPAAAMSYWAPEQRDGLGDQQSDIYALGLILLEMLTGQPPTPDGQPPPLNGLASSTQARLAPLVTRMLAADPGQRVTSAATVAAEFRDAIHALDEGRDSPASTTGPMPAPDTWGPTRRAAALSTQSTMPPRSQRSAVRDGDGSRGAPWLIGALIVAVVLVIWLALRA
ncbi:MAG: serine/threonine-protein kinase [Vicinamibacterales bacterium]